MIRTLTIIYATGTGHTEFVVDTVMAVLAQSCPDVRLVKQRAEISTPEDMMKGDALLLACGTWNTNNIEGQLSPFMYDFLTVRGAKEDLKGMPSAAIGLGDQRYFFTAKAADKLTEYLQTHHATIMLPALKVINDPFDQAAKIRAWAKEFAVKIATLPVTPAS
ncbi:MAG: flavodoxin domain-containing protein [Candidatus Peribacteraceae bacterium]|nr:flavodoxin domain-containing protein [Candidatus Peribacteraceae bacterium]MBP9850554.1 flavodoxin domain-containing protein [Candidatus Peribacteraceae bacterium]